ncbi:MAG TPA: oligosaccharide flippase family protein [Anaerolineae bacterium]|nr:oligosaccharide flippase family protein [Anaerolineae bacterium]
MENLRQHWRKDLLLQKVVRNSGYLLSSNVFSVIQSILTGRLLGIMGFGIIGTITVFASTFNRLFSFRMNELVVKYYGEFTTKHQLKRASAVIKAAIIAESTSALLSFIICILLAPYAALKLADDPSTAQHFILYSTIILANFITETSTGVLQVNNRFRDQAKINFLSNILTALVIVWAYLTKGGLHEIVTAYMLGKFVIGLGTAIIGFRELNSTLGKDWWKTSFKHLPAVKELFNFAFSTNISSTIIMLVRDNEVLWIAYFLSPLEAGYAKTALAIINLVQMPITPLISTTYPEINHAVTKRDWKIVKSLIKKVTLISGGWTCLSTMGLALFGKWLLLFYGHEFIPAYSPMLLFLIGLGYSNIFFWNRPLLLSLGLPLVPYKISLWCGIAKISLTFLLVPSFGLGFEAMLLSAFFVISITWIVVRGLQEIHNREKADAAGATA